SHRVHGSLGAVVQRGDGPDCDCCQGPDRHEEPTRYDGLTVEPALPTHQAWRKIPPSHRAPWEEHVMDSLVHIVDDDESVRNALDALFRSVDLKTQLHRSPQEFLDAQRPDLPSCLVLDVRLPGMSGLDFQERLAQLKLYIPIVLITGHGDIPM